ncbi:MAG: class I SAM-dependent methyltransferase [Betaproteobacteria bacterium]|nr:class I SAM-dependent methyltransferase [Betaproteobacteria bacterium]MDE2621668.1 class I SAM-dependent methyltransferase [Betaproteobacteria bacterium]
MTPEMQALKARLKATWMAGDYGYFAQYLEPGAMEFFRALGISPGERVLDVACGAGQLSLPAARAGAAVTAVDIAPNLIEQAKARAHLEGLAIRFEEGDAECLPYEDASFDLVFSLIGAMFAPQPERTAAELIRLCRPGGRIVMGNWNASGLVGEMFKIVGQHVPPRVPLPSPTLWGDEETVRSRLQNGTSNLQLVRKLYPMHFPFAPAEVVEFFRVYYGPVNCAFASLGDAGQAALGEDLKALWTRHNKAEEGSTLVEAEYLEVSAVRAI